MRLLSVCFLVLFIIYKAKGDATEDFHRVPSPTFHSIFADHKCRVDCSYTGYCKRYKTCHANDSTSIFGSLETHECDYDPVNTTQLYWDPESQNGEGACAFFDQLSNKLQTKYRDDPECPAPEIRCYFKKHPTCHNKYLHLPPGHDSNKFEQERCCLVSKFGQSLYWNQTSLNCGFRCEPYPATCNYCECTTGKH